MQKEALETQHTVQKLLRNQNDTVGRTTQVPPREAQVTGQIRRTKNCNYKEIRFILSLPYIGQAKQGAKHIKNPHVQGARTKDNRR